MGCRQRRSRGGPERYPARRRPHRRRRSTSLRLIESAAAEDGTLAAYCGETALFITPGYRFRAVDAMLTNFHLPRSTLFMLVSAFCGLDVMRRAYAHANRERLSVLFLWRRLPIVSAQAHRRRSVRRAWSIREGKCAILHRRRRAWVPRVSLPLAC